jgi:hypothetical protein
MSSKSVFIIPLPPSVKTIYLTSLVTAVTSLMAISSPAAELVFGSRVLVSENNQNFNISVFPGAASYDNTGTLRSNPPLLTNDFGGGTVIDYNFFHSPTETIESYAKGEAGLISDATCPPENIGGAGENWSNVWTTTDPVGFTTTKDFNSGAVANTFARSAEITGTINIAGLTEGTVYFPHGTFINQWSLTLTMSGSGQPDIIAIDADTANGAGTNFGWISDFAFADAATYDQITYTYTNADRDGSRARFMGVILDGILDFGPGDSDSDFLDDLWEDEFFGDNSGTVEPSDLTVTDGSGDADADGATDRQEHDAASDPNVKDTDDDGLEDGPEINTFRSDPNLKDTDGDNLEDGPEVNLHGSDPTLVDTDGDTLNDDEEVAAGVDGFVTDPALVDTDDDGVSDDLDTEPTDPTNDNDGDGLGNRDERDVHSTDPLVDDSDGDGILDGEEVVAGEDGFVTSALTPDTDLDGFSDSQEISLGSDPTDTDSIPAGVANVGFLERILVSRANSNFDLSVFPGAASYNDRGLQGTDAAPGEPSFTKLFGDGTVLDYNLVGNDGTGSALTTYASGELGLIPTPTAPIENVHGAGEDWANVWTVTDPEGFTTTKNHNPTDVAGAANTFARAAEVTGTIDISDLNAGTVFIPHGTASNNWTLTLTLSGAGQEDVVAIDTQDDGPNTNLAWISSFAFHNPGAYDTLTYNYTNGDRDGSRARFMGVILVAALDSTGPQITKITYTRTTAPDNIIVDLTFTSKEGKEYSIFSSGDFADPLGDRADLDDGVPAAVGASTTNFQIDFNALALPLPGRQFFVVRENP